MNILDKDLSPEEEKVLRESLDSWREEVYSNLMEEVEQKKQDMINELEEANLAYRETLKEEFSDKLIKALNEMRDEIVAEVTSELVTSNPELQILEKIKELVAPTLNEEYVAHMYAEEITTLRSQIKELEEEKVLDEGARTLAELISGYSDKTQNLLINLINPGSSEDITEQFYSIVDSISEGEKGEDADEDVIADLEKLLDGADEETAKKIQKIIDKMKPEEDPEEKPEDEEGAEKEPELSPEETSGEENEGEKPSKKNEGFESEMESYIKEETSKKEELKGKKLNQTLAEIRGIAGSKK